MEYNSVREQLLYPEYGRNIQKLILHALEIEDERERQHYIEKIIDLIEHMNPKGKRNAEQQEKLWKHMMHIAGYKLKVKPPEGIVIDPEDIHKRPDPLSYPDDNSQFLHYGHNVRNLIAKAMEMTDEKKQRAFSEVIGSYMKMAYRNWNKEHFINDEIIRQDFERMANGKLTLPEDANLNMLNGTSQGGGRRKKRGSPSKSKSGRGRRRK